MESGDLHVGLTRDARTLYVATDGSAVGDQHWLQIARSPVRIDQTFLGAGLLTRRSKVGPKSVVELSSRRTLAVQHPVHSASVQPVRAILHVNLEPGGAFV